MPWYNPASWTDRSVISATGTNQQVAGAAPNRRAILIKNGASQTGVNFLNASAVIGGSGTFTLQPYEPLFMSGEDCPKGPINLISVSAAYVTVLEGFGK